MSKTETNIELKKCPHCGKNTAIISSAKSCEECMNFESDKCPNYLYNDDDNCSLKFVVCDVHQGGCGASSGWYNTEEEAAKAWNRRTEDR